MTLEFIFDEPGEIDFSSRKQNSTENQNILDKNIVKFNYQCRLVLRLLQEGNKLTTAGASRGYYDKWEKDRKVIIGDLRARIRDLRVYYKIEDEKFDGGFKKYFIKNEFNQCDKVYCYDLDGIRKYGIILKNTDYPNVSEWYIKYEDGEECAVLEISLVYKA